MPLYNPPPGSVDLLFAAGKFYEMEVGSEPAAPAAGKARVFAVDNAGKVELKVLFPSGASLQLAIEA